MTDFDSLSKNLPKLVRDNIVTVYGQWSGNDCLIDSLTLGPEGLCRVSSTGMISLDEVLSEEGRRKLNQYSLTPDGNPSIQQWFGFLFRASPEWGGAETYDEEPPVGTEYLHASLGWPCKSPPSWDAAALEAALGYPDGDLVDAVDAGLTAAPELVTWSDLSHETRTAICDTLAGGLSSDVFFAPLVNFVVSTLGATFSTDHATYTWQQLGEAS